MASIEQCISCKRWFSVSEHPMSVPGGREREPINCPHCHATAREEMTDGFWRTKPENPPEST